VIRTGASWREVPEDFGPWQTINTRYRRWRQTGIWQQILDALTQDESSDATS
jgi:transposase